MSYKKQFNDPNSIFYKLCEKIDSDNGRNRYNISFASKFCFYGAKYLNIKNDFSIYDNVVSDAMVWYCKAYLNENLRKKDFALDSKAPLSDRLNMFKLYCDKIEEILSAVNSEIEENKLSKENFDHIVWYGLK